ncbi:MAG: winged helix-turn-helix domain-containing protein [Methylococcaceae bacterium]|nr:winged helix-turn-helix domain-containing protein [Methylococcaceae bacterium]
MKKINKIVVLDDDHYFLALLKGYCCGVNIGLQAYSYDLNGVSEAEKLNPDMIAIPLESVLAKNNQAVAHLLRKISLHNNIAVVALNKNSIDYNGLDFLDWIDAIIEKPYDIGNLDAYLKSSGLLGTVDSSDLIDIRDQRKGTDRRQIKINGSGEILYCDRRINDDRRMTSKRRNNAVPDLTKEAGVHSFYIDHRNKCLFVKGQKIELTPKEFELLLFLSTDVERVFTAEEIINHLWPESHRATKSDLYQYMHLLRKKIEPDPNSPQWIRNVKGFGYKLEIGHV